MSETVPHAEQRAEPRVLRDRYVVVRRLGHGGMSTVYLGEDRVLKRRVAIKELLPALAEDAAARQRFQREAEAVARLKHPGILEVYDFGMPEEREPFIVMEYVDGLTFRRFVENHAPLLPEAAARLAASMASALQLAHDHGVIHRDLKPENVMIARDGRILLMDFGIAHVMGLTKLTLTGALVGSPAHMAPEVIEGAEAGPEADIFAVGTVLYCALTGGALPFEGRTPHEVMKRIVDGRYSDVRTEAPLVGSALASVVDRCLAREPSARYASAGDLAAALEAVIPSGLVPPTDDLIRQYFGASEAFKEKLRAGLTTQLETDLATARTIKDRAGVVDSVNRLLAIDAGHTDALRALDDLSRTDARRRWMRLILAALILGGGAWAGHQWLTREMPAPPPPTPATIVETRPDPATTLALAGISLRALEAPVRSKRRGAEPAPVARAVAPAAPSGRPDRAGTPRRADTVVKRPGRGSRPSGRRDNPARGGTRATVDGSGPAAAVPDAPEKPTVREAPAGPFPISILASPPAAKIFVDGAFRGFGRTDGLQLSSGSHEVRLEHPGCAACAVTNYTLQIDGDRPPRQSVRYRIRYRPASLRVVTPTDGKVFLDDRYVGPTNLPLHIDMKSARARRARMRVAAGGAVLAPRDVTLQPGEETRVVLE